VKGRKRHLLVDVLGLVLRVLVHPADWQDKRGLRPLLLRLPHLRRLKKVLLDGTYRSQPLRRWARKYLSLRLEIVQPPKGQKGFTVLPKRWVVERTFAWLGKYRRLSKDYEQLPSVSESWIYVSMIHLMLRRLVS
jgi:putative transposase